DCDQDRGGQREQLDRARELQHAARAAREGPPRGKEEVAPPTRRAGSARPARGPVDYAWRVRRKSRPPAASAPASPAQRMNTVRTPNRSAKTPESSRPTI